MNKILSLLTLTAAFAASAQTAAPLWMRDAKISPDGSQIAFTYKGDIFTVPVQGGEAHRVTSQPSYEEHPIWSPDSKTIAFASDRHGNMNIFTVPADGKGEWKRITFTSKGELPEAFTPDGKSILYSAAIQDPASSALYPTGRMTEVYSVPVTGGAPTQLFATPAREISWSPDGKSFLYQDVKGFENTWRKHHTSSVTRNIVRYTPATGKHTPVVTNPGEDLSPVDAGEYIYFLSERAPQKSLNVYRAPASNPADAKAITDFKKHPVRFLSRAANGTRYQRREAPQSEGEHQRRLSRRDTHAVVVVRRPQCHPIARRQADCLHIPRRRICNIRGISHHKTDFQHSGSRSQPLLGQRLHTLLCQ